MHAALKEHLDKVKSDVRGSHPSGESTSAAMNADLTAPPSTQLVELMPGSNDFLLPQGVRQPLPGVEPTWQAIDRMSAPGSDLSSMVEGADPATGQLLDLLSSQAQMPLLSTSQGSSQNGAATSTVSAPQPWPGTHSEKDPTAEIFERIFAGMR